MRNINVLVTSGAGQLGSNLVISLVEKGAIVNVVDNLWRGSKLTCSKMAKPFINGDQDFLKLTW